ncbi:hypothetical protein J3369_16110 [Alteromonas sp. NFXS44]|uniref:hypothetical protein n=1 Tax=Alteromonas sp. NFXS44 TaxID=2818435 RepID=UPI0032DFA3DC
MNNTNTNTDSNIQCNKFINNHCSKRTFNNKRSQCKLTSEINENLKLPTKHIKLINDFYCAITIKDRDTALRKIIDDDSFFQRNAELLYRYVDGYHWMNPDFDRVVIGYYTSFKNAKKISDRLKNGSLPEGWEVKSLKKKENYSNKWILRMPSGNNIRLFFCNIKNESYLRQTKIDFSPSYFSDKELRIFFSWFNTQLGNERVVAIEESLVALMENGLQLHQIFTPLVIHRSLLGREKRFNWEVRGEEQDFIQASYDRFLSECGSNITNKIYCPVSKLFNLIFKDRSFTQTDARTLIESISHAARLESVYKYSLKNKAREYSLCELEKVPNFLEKFDLIAPDSFVDLGPALRERLMKKRFILKTNCNLIRSVNLSSSVLETKRITMLERYKEIFFTH